MIGEESIHPYTRPPLSKAYLQGMTDEQGILLRSAEAYVTHDINVLLDRRVARIDRDGKAVVLDDGTRIAYGRLVLATGGSPRTLGTPEIAAADNVLTLRTLSDSTDLRRRMVAGARAVIIGGGYIGLELAAVARSRGLKVTVLEAAPRVLARVTAPVMSEFFQRVHSEEGVNVILGASIDGFITDGDGRVTAVVESGKELAADFVLVGIGLQPRVDLAVEAGLDVDNGIIVNEQLLTSDPDIFAIGDVARHPDVQHGGLRRLESVPNASEQARVVAARLVGTDSRYHSVPWFWSDQYDVKLQVAGLATGYDDIIVRGTATTGRSVTVFYLREGKPIAVDVVNRPAEFAMARKIIAAGVQVDVSALGDESVGLRELIQRAAPVT